MGSNWERVKIEQLQDNQKGAIAIGPFGSRMKSDCYVPYGIPVVRGTNISSGPNFKGDFVYISPELADTLGSCNVYKNDLIFPHRGSIGEVGIINDNNRYVLSSSMMKLTCDCKKVKPMFLYYFFKSQKGKNELLKNASQVGTPGIAQPLSSLKQIEIELPPLSIQNKIIEIIESLDKKISLNNNLNQILEQMSQTIFKSWFVDFDPVIDNALDAGNPIPEALQSRAELRQKVRNSADFKPLPADIRALFPAEFEETELGWVPKGWKISTAGDELVVKGGSTPSTSNADFWENGTIHWTSPKDLTGNDSKVLLDTSKKITELGLKKISSGLLPTDTVLMSSRAPIGYLALAKTPMAINQGYIAIPSSKNLSSEYIIYWLENIMDDIKGMAGGTTFAEISKSAFKTINLVIPSKNIVDEFTRLAHQHFEKVVSNTRQITALTNLRDTLLPKLISGELSLEDLPNLVDQTEPA